MSNIKYDPGLPLAFISPADREVARFADREIAARFGKHAMVGRVVDTTPKPKIPDEAEFIYYYKSGYDFYVRQLENGDWKTDGGVLYTYPEILEVVEDAEVTVLVRKEDS